MNKKAAGKIDTKKKIGLLPPLGNYPSRAEWEAACWREILASKALLQLLITSHERHDIIMRAAILEGLAAGKSYRRIGEEMWVSPQTISAVKKALREKNYRSYLERSKKERIKRKYSASTISNKPKRRGRPIRTKYGTIYMPY